jgi:hypothetical protein
VSPLGIFAEHDQAASGVPQFHEYQNHGSANAQATCESGYESGGIESVINLFCGYDQREAIGFHVFVHSVLSKATQPVQIIPLSSMGLPQGSNAFTQSRFMVPRLMGYQGHAIFADACDMLAQSDIGELDALFDNRFAIQVVKHAPYKTQHKTKYRGTAMECPNRNYPRKNWASVCIFNCAHPIWRELEISGFDMLELMFIPSEAIGELPAEWNRLADEGQPTEDAKVLHWTAGVPAFDHYRDAPAADKWHTARRQMEIVG